jgi:hypothetical protein
MVAQACNPSYTQEAEIRRIMVCDELGHKVHNSSQAIKAGYGDTCLSSQLHGKHKKRIKIQVDLVINARPYLKNRQKKKAWGTCVANTRP